MGNRPNFQYYRTKIDEKFVAHILFCCYYVGFWFWSQLMLAAYGIEISTVMKIEILDI